MNDFVPFLNERTNFTKNIEKNLQFFMELAVFLKRTIFYEQKFLFKEQFFWTNDFIEQMVLLNDYSVKKRTKLIIFWTI